MVDWVNEFNEHISENVAQRVRSEFWRRVSKQTGSVFMPSIRGIVEGQVDDVISDHIVDRVFDGTPMLAALPITTFEFERFY